MPNHTRPGCLLEGRRRQRNSTSVMDRGYKLVGSVEDMRTVSLALITSLALATAAPCVATDSGAPRDSRVGLTGERLKARLAQQQLLGSKRLRLLTYSQGAEAAGPEIKRLRFESWVDVWGKAPRDPNEAISAFLQPRTPQSTGGPRLPPTSSRSLSGWRRRSRT